ncbi:MAG TPA: phosphatase PAP2 family protein [Gaiellaceae bacterium]|nr:phosphatase PAP2 family protein [Gaiellaceae bacterium]
MDWSLFHAINALGRHDDSVQDTALAYNAVAIFAIVALAGFLWFLARPGGSLKPKLAAASAAFSVVIGLLLNVVAGSLWHHDRPFVDHPRQTVLLVHHVADNSFPSDHSTVAFAAAFAVFVFYRRLGAVLVLAAIGVAIARMLVGVHYPVDVAASLVIGAASASVVIFAGRPHVLWVVRRASRLSDPVVAAARGIVSRH